MDRKIKPAKNQHDTVAGGFKEISGSLKSDISGSESDDKLRRSEALFRSIFELPTTGIALVSFDMRWHLVNKVLLGILGYEEEEFNTVSWDKIVLPEDLEGDMIRYHMALNGKIDSWTLERQMVRKDGETIWVIMTSACFRKTDNSVDYFVIMIQDFSRQKQYEKEIAELNARLREMINERTGELTTINATLVDEIHKRQKSEEEQTKLNSKLKLMQECLEGGIWEIDFETNIHSWSEELYRLMDIERDTIPSSDTWIDPIHPEDRETVINEMKRKITDSDHFEIQYRIICKNGEIRKIKACGKIEKRNNIPVHAAGICFRIN